MGQQSGQHWRFVVPDDDYSERRGLTFAQAEGAEPLPGQLRRTEISPQLSALMWAILNRDIRSSIHRDSIGFRDGVVVGRWAIILQDFHVFEQHLPVDEFDNDAKEVLPRVKSIIFSGSYLQFFGFLQFVVRHPQCTRELKSHIRGCLEQARAAFRLIHGDTFIPLASEEEAEIVERAFTDVSTAGFGGARTHLGNAAQALTEGRFTDSVRESIHSVEIRLQNARPFKFPRGCFDAIRAANGYSRRTQIGDQIDLRLYEQRTRN